MDREHFCTQQPVCPADLPSCELLPGNAHPLILAEQVCVNAIRASIEGVDPDNFFFHRIRTGFHLVDLGLAHPDDQASDDAFDQAKTSFADLCEHPDIHTSLRIKAGLLRDFVPIFQARRNNLIPYSELRNNALLAYTKGVRELLPHTTDFRDGGSVDSRLVGIYAECNMGALLSLAGYLPYISTKREGSTIINAPEYNHDYYLLKHGFKFPALEVKYKTNVKSHDYDSSRVLLLSFFDVCNEVVRDMFVQHERPGVHKFGYMLATALAKPEGEPLDELEQQIVRRAASEVGARVKNWRRENRH